MRLLLIVLIVLTFAPAPDPHLTAHWTSPTSSVVTWTQQARACLYHESAGGAQTFVGCYTGSGVARVEFGRVGPMDGALRPHAGDSYIAQIDGVTYRAALRSVSLFPLFRA